MNRAFWIKVGIGAVGGWWGAAKVDLEVFAKWTDPAQAKTWNWRVALLRWAQGAIGGALAGAGLGELTA